MGGNNQKPAPNESMEREEQQQPRPFQNRSENQVRSGQSNPPPLQSKVRLDIPEEEQARASRSKLHHTTLIRESKSEKELRVGQSTVSYKEYPEAKADINQLKGIDYEKKIVKKFSLNAIIEPKDNIKESYYFDESNGPIDVALTARKEESDFRMGEIEEFKTFAVKRYIYGCNLTHKIQA